MKTNKAVMGKIQLRQEITFQETYNNYKTTKIQSKKETNDIFRQSIPHIEKPAHLVARGTDSTSVQRRYRAAWRPNKRSFSSTTDRIDNTKDTDTRRFGEKFLTAIILQSLAIFTTLIHSSIRRGAFQAGTLVLGLGIVYILITFYLVDYMSYIMDTCSPELAELLAAGTEVMKQFSKILNQFDSISLCAIITTSTIGGVLLWHLLYMIYNFIRKRHVPGVNSLSPFVQLNDLNNFDARILRMLYKKISNPEILIDLGLSLSINLDDLEALQYENTNIRVAGFYVLMRWYKKQDGLGPESEGLQKLKDALSEAKLNSCVREIDNILRDPNR